MQEFFSISLIITQHLNRSLGTRAGVSLSKVSKYKRGLALEENTHILLSDLGGSMGIDQDFSQPRNPAITCMNYMQYDFGVFNHQDLSNVSKLRRALSFSNFPWMNCNVAHPMTKEPFFGEPYQMFTINGMKLVVVSGYGGDFIPEEGDRDPTLHISGLGSSVKRWLRYIYDSVDPDYVIVCISDWDGETAAVHEDMEGVGMLITGSPGPEADGGETDGADAGGDDAGSAAGVVLSPRISASKYETYNVPEDGRVPMYHHHHNSQVMHVSLNFKTRTTTYEYLGHSVARIDQEVSQLSEDYNLLDLVHYHL
ncbi:hypothetical protein WN59_10395 [Salinicoccus sediminis]|uniref:Uncharacterized protein n=1 Tax=Salinicoccus sediminis TaxID=1432562 RepID=A0A0M2SGZ8_9STAP|nr:hypothetical protein [Salinicoccus sediminis]KKK33999.1 hypothetical protein WN59_10395 [Salinicoccus sediminis]